MKTKKARTTNRYRYNPLTASKKQSTKRRKKEEEELLKGLGGESKVGVEMLLAAAAAAEQREEDDKQERLLEEYNAHQLRIVNAPGGSVSEVVAPLPVQEAQYKGYLDAIDEDLAKRKTQLEEKSLNAVDRNSLEGLINAAGIEREEGKGGRRRTRKSRRRSASRRQTRKSRRRSASRRRSRH